MIDFGDFKLKENTVIRIKGHNHYWKFKWFNPGDESVTVYGPCNKHGSNKATANWRTFKLEKIKQ